MARRERPAGHGATHERELLRIPLAEPYGRLFRARVAKPAGVLSDLPGAVQERRFLPHPAGRRSLGLCTDAGKFHGWRSGGHCAAARLHPVARRDVPVSDAHLPRTVEPQVRHGRLFRDRPGLRHEGRSAAAGRRCPRARDAHHPRRRIQPLRLLVGQISGRCQKRQSVAVSQLVLHPQLSRRRGAAELRLRRALQMDAEAEPCRPGRAGLFPLRWPVLVGGIRHRRLAAGCGGRAADRVSGSLRRGDARVQARLHPAW